MEFAEDIPYTEEWEDIPYTEEWQHRHRIRSNAVVAVREAVKSGRLKKPDRCQACGRPVRRRKHKVKPHSQRYPRLRKYAYRLEAHHWSYHKEHLLDVIWLCPECHHLIHLSKQPEYPAMNKHI